MRCTFRFLVALLSSFVIVLATATKTISYNKRSFLINEKPLLLLSGSVHYTRVPKSDWDGVFKTARELGLNCIQTLVIWNKHEPTRGKINWGDDDGDGLLGFLELAAANDLYVNLRIGPYICGEYYFGGLPLWLRHVDDIGCFRCSDPIWEREMERWTKIVVDKIRPLLITNGGPIIMLQIENEYSRFDEYAKWSVDMARNITTDVPWEMCHSVPQCGQLNQDANEDKVLCAINGFWMDEGGGGGQPGPEFFEELWSKNKDQPALWTEDQGWFDKWGYGQRVRWTSDQLYGMARFFAYGGSYHNFYMLTGGNNYERHAGGDATTGYASDTVIDNLFLRHEPRFTAYQRFFQVLRTYETDLLSHPAAKPVPLARSQENGTGCQANQTNAEAHGYGRLVFLSNSNERSNESGMFDYKGKPYYLSNNTVVIIDTSSDGTVLFNTSSTMLLEETHHTTQEKASSSDRETIPISQWRYFQEKVGYGAIKEAPSESPEQLNITNNDSDYLWYTFWTKQQTGEISVRQYGYDGLRYIYVDGTLSSSIIHLTFNDMNTQTGRALRETATAQLPPSQHRIDVFSVAMGLFNGGVGPSSTKGVINVTVGNSTNNVTYTEFSTQWMLLGEELEVYTGEGSKRADWKPVSCTNPKQDDSLSWFQGKFDLPVEYHSFAGKGQPNQTALVANLRGGGLNKGVVYVNGFNIGRYWLKPGECEGECAPPQHGSHCYIHWKGCGEPTQSLYHIPFEVLRSRDNLITFFEETAAVNSRNLNEVKIQVLHHHPDLS